MVVLICVSLNLNLGKRLVQVGDYELCPLFA